MSFTFSHGLTMDTIIGSGLHPAPVNYKFGSFLILQRMHEPSQTHVHMWCRHSSRRVHQISPGVLFFPRNTIRADEITGLLYSPYMEQGLTDSETESSYMEWMYVFPDPWVDLYGVIYTHFQTVETAWTIVPLNLWWSGCQNRLNLGQTKEPER